MSDCFCDTLHDTSVFLTYISMFTALGDAKKKVNDVHRQLSNDISPSYEFRNTEHRNRILLFSSDDCNMDSKGRITGPPSRAGSSPAGYAQYIMSQVTAPENRTTVKAVGFFAVRTDRSRIVQGADTNTLAHRSLSHFSTAAGHRGCLSQRCVSEFPARY